jgi:hypothetical protein
MTRRLNMIRAICLTTLVAGLIAAAAAFETDPPVATYAPKAGTHIRTHNVVHGHSVTAYVKGNVLNPCFAEPVECGLVVW